MKTKAAHDYLHHLQNKAHDPKNLHATLIFAKDNRQSERIGWLDAPESHSQTQAWIQELIDAGYTPIGVEVIKKDPEVFEPLPSDWLDPEEEALLAVYQASRETKSSEQPV